MSSTGNRPDASFRMPAPNDAGAEALSREQLMERILEANPSASRDFLDRFSTEQLDGYLSHLSYAAEPRGTARGWVNPEGPRRCA